MKKSFLNEFDSKNISVYLNEYIKPGDWLFLDGDLGAGKTTLVQSLFKELGAPNAPTSPTFPILNVESFLHKKSGLIWKILHLDLYRLKRPQDLFYLGIEMEYTPHNSIVIVEWPSVIDLSGWESFFQVTNCLRPQRLFELKIEGDGKQRSYFLSSSFSLCRADSSK